MSLWFTVPGKAIGKQRARVVVGARGAHAFTPEATVNYEMAVKMAALQAGAKPVGGPVEVSIVVVRSVPKSYSKKKREACLAGLYAMSKPDLDNVAKSVLDGMNGVAYADDTAVAKLHVSRIWGESGDSTTVEVKEIEA